MKNITFAFVMGLALATAAWGQQKEAPKPEAPKVEAPAKAVQKKAARKSSAKRQQDARHCLQRGDNTAIIKCAEEYL